MSATNQRRKDAGLCIDCGDPKVGVGVRCSACARVHAANFRNYYVGERRRLLSLKAQRRMLNV